jgi:hypothetical protein
MHHRKYPMRSQPDENDICSKNMALNSQRRGRTQGMLE